MEEGTQMTITIADPRVVKDGGLYSAYCDELGLASSGTTKREAIKNLENAIISYCRSLDEIDLLEKRLGEKGIQFEVFTPKDVGDKRGHLVLVS